MKKETIQKFLAALGQHETFEGPVWITARCPLAPFTHKKGTDTKPSFAVSMKTGAFNCFSCQQGSLNKLLQTLEMYVFQHPELASKYQFALARQILDEVSDVDPLPDYEDVQEEKHFEPWSDWSLDFFQPWCNSDRARWYLKSGRVEADPKNQPVSEEIADFFCLRYDSIKDMIVCPYWNFSGMLAGARGRAISQDAGLKHFDYTWNGVNNAQLVWYNEVALDRAVVDHRPVVVVEGQFDCMNVARSYPYVVAGLTAKSSKKKLEKLQGVDSVVVMLDNDETGDSAWSRYTEVLGDKVMLGRMSFPAEYKDPAQIPLDVLNDLMKDLF